MKNNDVIKTICESKIVAIIRKVAPCDILNTAEALLKGGIMCQEVTFNHDTRGALSDTVSSLKQLKESFKDDILIGAGTVLTAEEVDMAVEAGAEYIISPNWNADVIIRTKQRGKVSIPGAFSPSEVVSAYEAGADIIKIFPAKTLGTGYIKSVKAVFGHIPIFAVGGVNADNAKDFIDAGCSGVGVGGNLVSLAAIKERNFIQLTETAKDFMKKINDD